MKTLQNKQQGFILLLSIIMLLIITILVLNSVRTTTMNEKISGGYMDRSRAQSQAELAIVEGQGSLVSSPDNADKCRTGCSVISRTSVTDGAIADPNLPGAWPANGNGVITSNDGKSQFVVQLLTSAHLLAAKRAGCTPYSIMGRGVGNDIRTVVVLQVVASVCDLSS